VAVRRAKGRRVSADVVRNDQVVRILRLIRDLARIGASDLYQLAERYGTTTRTIRRDFDALRECGIPVLSEPGEGARVRWYIDTSSSSKLTNMLEASHFLALRVAMAEAGALRRNESLFAVMEDISTRIEHALGPKQRDALREIDRCFLSWEKFAWKEAPHDVMWPLVGAISSRRQCVVSYRAPSGGNTEKRYRVLPLRLVVHNGAMYLHAWQSHYKTVLLLNLQRLQKLEVLDEVGEVPPEYDPDTLEHSAFGVFIGKTMEKFELRFDAFARPYIEERSWHPSQELEPLADGGVVLRFSCTPSYEVSNWVASWQQHVEVISPKKLRGEFKAYGQWLAAKYAGEE